MTPLHRMLSSFLPTWAAKVALTFIYAALLAGILFEAGHLEGAPNRYLDVGQ